ncbi:MAG: TonB family protein [Alphaproteobacteria bacterium]|nr:TonB family protein [Alphaproteobacteria bacterium]
MAFDQIISKSTPRRISPVAFATSALMHVLIASAFLSALPQRQIHAPLAAVEITVDMTAAQAADAAPRTQASDAEQPARKPTQMALHLPEPPPPADQAPVELAPSLPESVAPEIATRTMAPRLPEPAPPGPNQQQAAVMPQTPPPSPALEKVLPSIEAPPAPSARDFAGDSARSAPPTTAKAPTPSAPTPSRALPSEPKRAPVRAAPSPAAPVSTAADEGRQRQTRQDYLSQIIRKLSQHKVRTAAPAEREQGLVVLRLTVARDGRLVDLALASSSGSPDLDRGVMETAQKASPFAPLPADIAAAPYTLTVPISYVHDR